MEVILDGVQLRRGRRTVLSIGSLQIRANRTTAILGPNGAGKTTLLRVIAGLQRPDEGTVMVGGAPAAPRLGRVAFVFQQEVFLRCSLQENLELGLRIRGVDAERTKTFVAASLERLGIAALAERRADRLSGGEARRASLARAFALAAPVVLLDEPLAGLDGAAYRRLLDDLPNLVGARDATTVVVTHRREEALRLSDDLVVLVDGRVLAFGSKHEVAANPRTRQVAQVLGYLVVDAGGRVLAVPDDAWRVGPGPVEFTVRVERVIDCVDRWELVAALGEIRIHVPLARDVAPPKAQELVRVHAPVSYEVR